MDHAILIKLMREYDFINNVCTKKCLTEKYKFENY